MNQKKIGNFLKELRNEKGITQEQFAEVLTAIVAFAGAAIIKLLLVAIFGL